MFAEHMGYNIDYISKYNHHATCYLLVKWYNLLVKLLIKFLRIQISSLTLYTIINQIDRSYTPVVLDYSVCRH